MHSTIFQITREKVSIENYIGQNSLDQGDGYPIDYCSEVSPEERSKRIKSLVSSVLPKGMFTLMDDDTIRYEGGIDTWKETWVNAIREKATLVTVDNIIEWTGGTEQLTKELTNPLHTDALFYIYEAGASLTPDKSDEFMRMVAALSKGDCLYIGGVLDYRF